MLSTHQNGFNISQNFKALKPLIIHLLHHNPGFIGSRNLDSKAIINSRSTNHTYSLQKVLIVTHQYKTFGRVSNFRPILMNIWSHVY